MKKFWYFTAACLIVIGVAGALTVGWESNKGDLPEFEKKWTFSASDLRKLQIESDYEVNVKFVKSTDGQNSIQLNGHATEKTIEKVLATEISNQSLTLDLTRSPKKYINFFDFNFVTAKEEFVISVSDDALLDLLKIDVDSGDINITDATLIPITVAELSADSGNLDLNRFRSDSLNAEVDSGNIRGDHVTANITASADSGNIRLENTTGQTTLSVDSGNIRLYKLDTSNTDITADSGNVYVQVPSSFAGFYDLKVDSGTSNAPESKRETKDFVKVRVDSGNIKIEQQP
ncbi:DUF4097 family beta strand repeat-containing protein [Cohnella herbarum]|uniref:DUF4097 domain-containing protein n=1 Tax=Cohnella herbarum TaxID=2728023 RepID=A0A7Z2VLL5_9BACL|nr:DUF4097 family beta strand repeat-containing protein [Cohnella herbarum]QJD85348.1 DUF4097 domain-containing protein [Cohnella herbarum]